MDAILRRATEIRIFEQSLLDMYKEGQISGTVHTCLGQELTACFVAENLNPKDFVTSNHRGHGHYLARTADFRGLFAEIMGRTEGVCRGIGGTQHLATENFLANGIQGGLTPVAVGIAWAQKLRKDNAMTVSFIGDGTLGEGVLYESLNIASLRQIPILFVVENNHIAQSTPLSQNLAGSIDSRFAAFGLKVFSADSRNAVETQKTTQDAFKFVRQEKSPAVLIIDCARLGSHSKGDDTRSDQEISKLWSEDYLHSAISKSKELQELATAMKSSIQKWNQETSEPQKIKPTEYHKSVTQWTELSPNLSDAFWGKLLSEAFSEKAKKHPELFFLGEDVAGDYGGAFKISKSIAKSSPDRVANMPISEAAIVGVATGMAIMGHRPFAELMFGDFITLAADQIINHATKFSLLYRSLFPLNMVIRTPMGGYRGYGATHSQSLEKIFLGCPGLTVIAPSLLTSPQDLLSELLSGAEGPMLMIENKSMYASSPAALNLENFRILKSSHKFPIYNLTPRSNHHTGTIICYGGMLAKCLEAAQLLFQQHDQIIQIVVLTQLYPMPVNDLIQTLDANKPVLFVEEGTSFASLSGEIAYEILKANKNAPFERHGSQELAIPASRELEAKVLPSPQSITNSFLQAFVNS